MTLFKKVFQHQGNPVDQESNDIPKITPVEERVEDHDTETSAPLHLEAEPDTFVLDVSNQVFEETVEVEDHADDDPAPTAEQIDWAADEPGSIDAKAEEDWNEPDLAYVLEQARPDTAPEGAFSAEAVDPEVGPEPIMTAAADPKPAHIPNVEAATDPGAIDMMDVAAFAREQMRVAGLAAQDPESDVAPAPTQAPDLDLSQPQSTPDDPVVGRAGRRAGRVKTRLLGFNRGAPDTTDPLDSTQAETAIQGRGKFPVGWLVVVDGPGMGYSFALFSGASMIGRGEDQVIKLDFGDNSISRQNHAAIAYDDEENKFFIGHGGKSNIIRLNARPVLSTEELHHSDLVRIGETTLRFVALCGKDFQWDHAGDTDATAV